MSGHNLSAQNGLVRILDSREFGNLEELRESAFENKDPLLLLVDPGEIQNVLSWMESRMDVCFHSDSSELIDFRCGKLQAKNVRRDPLTGLWARQQLYTELDRRLELASVANPLNMILSDIDYFKQVNDQFGHQQGDLVLQQCAKIILSVCDEDQVSGRIGGEEFCTVANCSQQEARELAERIRIEIKGHDFGEFDLTCSFGIATTTEATNRDDFLSRANQALYSAKANGRDRCMAFCDLEKLSKISGQEVDVVGLENQAQVLAQRVANVITMRSRKILNSIRLEADVDGLTGCFNRRYLDRQLESDFNDREQPLSIAFLDLDFFGEVNKTFGWPSGDKLLNEVCDLIRSEIRDTDWIGRYGGEEFCIVMPETELNQAVEVLQRIRKIVDATEFRSVDDKPVPMTVSIGAAVSRQQDISYQELVGRASEHALSAKRSGRNQIVA